MNAQRCYTSSITAVICTSRWLLGIYYAKMVLLIGRGIREELANSQKTGESTCFG